MLLACFGLQACAAAGVEEVDTAVSTTAQPPAHETAAAWLAANRDPDVPSLPFPDNPDPDQCGIPTAWGDEGAAWLNGVYEGELVQPTVLLYDSHSRLSIIAKGSHGAQVQVILYQQNPVLDYYLVKIEGAPKPNEGWVPGPFLSFNPVTELEDLPNNE
ncbi:MAG: hypothetical protein IPM53_29790 [Anaerolineaceae bacterium]|nr:hypothetical protein [Anaerolineaceae bacterium]